MSRPGFLHAYEQWRERKLCLPEEYFGDVYDGFVWKSFCNGYLSSPYSYLLTLNVDWFQPFKHLEYSVGGIYMTIQNLPRALRYREENIILVGIVPGLKEPSLTINSYLAPLVKELKDFYLGISLLSTHNTPVTVQLALSCVSCDIPASRPQCSTWL